MADTSTNSIHYPIPASNQRSTEFQTILLSRKTSILFSVGLCALFLFGEIYFSVWLIVASMIGVALFYIILKYEFIAFLSFIAIFTILALKPRTDYATGPLEVILGILIVSISLSLLIKIFVFQRQKFIYDTATVFLIFYFLWLMVIGVIGVAVWHNTFINWMREIMLQIALLIVPVLMVRSIDLKKNTEVIAKKAIFFIWLIIIFANILHLRQNIAQAYYLFQTGRAVYSTSFSSLMLFCSISLCFYEMGKRKKVLMMSIILIATVSIVISLYRTIWITDTLMIGVLFALAFRHERKQGLRTLAFVALGLFVIVAILYFASPLVSLLMRNFGDRLLSSSHVTVDPSLVNRYIEWRRVYATILNSPIVGFGFGGEFFDYNWLGGVSFWAGYTHNGYLALLLKGGVIGFIFFSIAYGMIISKGIRLSRNVVLGKYYRALARAGVALLIAQLIITLTLNTLANRDDLFWVGIVWGYFLLCEKHIHKKNLNEVA